MMGAVGLRTRLSVLGGSATAVAVAVAAVAVALGVLALGGGASAAPARAGLGAPGAPAFAPVALDASSLKITDCTSAVSRPAQLTLACADAGISLKALSWSSFGGSAAKGKGTLAINTCTPNCADGKFLDYAATVTASEPHSCGHGVRVYNKLTMSFPARKPPSAGRLAHWTLGCPY